MLAGERHSVETDGFSYVRSDDDDWPGAAMRSGVMKTRGGAGPGVLAATAGAGGGVPLAGYAAAGRVLDRFFELGE